MEEGEFERLNTLTIQLTVEREMLGRLRQTYEQIGLLVEEQVKRFNAVADQHKALCNEVRKRRDAKKAPTVEEVVAPVPEVAAPPAPQKQ